MSTPYLNLGIVSAYADAKRGGYTGTYDEFCALLAGIGGLQPKLTAGQNISITGTTIDTKAFPCSPNLLDNWYFQNPVNQRNGHVVPPKGPGHLYSDAACTSLISGGTIDAYRQVTPVSTGNYTYSVDGDAYYVKASDVVPGYTGAGYTIDRWEIGEWNGSGTVTIEANGIRLTSENSGPNSCLMTQKLKKPPLGTVFTMSILVTALGTNGGNLYFGVQDGNNAMSAYKLITEVGLYTLEQRVDSDNLPGDYMSFIWGQDASSAGSGNTDITVSAVKLELGSQQTLAHQENGVWMLNEIPDYGEQLRKCQRYCVAFNKYDSFRPVDNNDFVVELPVPMRAVPTIINPQNLTNANVTNPTVAWYNIGSNQLRLRSTASHGGSQAVCDGLVLFSADL